MKRAPALLALSCTLSACDSNLPAAGTMPQDYGPLRASASACPDLSGLYAWPPIDHPAPAVQATGKYSNSAQRFLGLPIYRLAQIWVDGPSAQSKQALRVHSRMVNRDPRYQVGSMAQTWSEQTIRYRCSGAWVVWDQLNADGQYQHSGRMAVLADGSLAVGQAARESGRRGAIFSWGGQSYGDIPLPDQVGVGWARLERLGPTGKGVPGEDASLSRKH